MSKPKPKILKTKQDIFHFITDDKKLFNYIEIGKLSGYWWWAWFTVDEVDYSIYVQNYVRRSGVESIRLQDKIGKTVSPAKVRELRRRIYEIREERRVRA